MFYVVAEAYLHVQPLPLRDPRFTLHCAQGAVEHSFGTTPAMQLTLAQAYRAAGQIAMGREEANKGLAILPAQHPNDSKPRLRRLLKIEAGRSVEIRLSVGRRAAPPTVPAECNLTEHHQSETCLDGFTYAALITYAKQVIPLFYVLQTRLYVAVACRSRAVPFVSSKASSPTDLRIQASFMLLGPFRWGIAPCRS
jgi:hypothetical protein